MKASRILLSRSCVGVLVGINLIGCGDRTGETSDTKVVNGIVYDNDSDRDGVNLATVRIWLKKDGGYYSCTATRVSEKVLLTAAHCLKSNSGTVDGLFIKGGFASKYDALADAYAIEKWSIHPRYSGAGQYDIGLIKVKASEVSRLSKHKIARVSFEIPKIYENVDMYGYGCAAENTVADGHKRYGTAVLLDSSVLSSRYRYVNVTPAQGFDPTEPRICSGDSGGPLVQTGKVVGVNTGIDSDYSYFARLDFDDVKTWYADIVDRN